MSWTGRAGLSDCGVVAADVEAPPGGRTRISCPTSIWLVFDILFQRASSDTERLFRRAIEYSVSPRSTR
jgi:hypothetical protein